MDITNNGDGVFLRAASAGWGNEGSNGGKVNLTAESQKIEGDMIVDDISILNLYLKDGSTFEGAINPDGEAGDVYVELTEGSKWILSVDSNISSLTCDADSIDLNGHTLTVDGKAYAAGTSSSGEAIEIKISEEGGRGEGMQAPPDGKGEPPQGKEGDSTPNGNKAQDGKKEPPQDGDRPTSPDGQPPEKPDGEPPQKPGGDNPPVKPE